MKRKQADAAAALAVAAASRSDTGATPSGAASIVADSVTPKVIKQAEKSTIL